MNVASHTECVVQCAFTMHFKLPRLMEFTDVPEESYGNDGTRVVVDRPSFSLCDCYRSATATAPQLALVISAVINTTCIIEYNPLINDHYYETELIYYVPVRKTAFCTLHCPTVGGNLTMKLHFRLTDHLRFCWSFFIVTRPFRKY